MLKLEKVRPVNKILTHPLEGTKFKVCISGVPFHCQPDSGSMANIINTSDFNKIREQNSMITLKAPSDKLNSITNHTLHITGVFRAELSTTNSSCTDKIFVSNLSTLKEPILSESALLTLGLISYSKNDRVIAQIHKTKAEVSHGILQKLVKQYPKVFADTHGQLGCFKNIEAEITLVEHAKSFIARPRSIPLHWESKVQEKLVELVRQGVLGYCKPDMPVQYCSALCIVKKRDGTPRVTVDFRQLNKYLARSRITSKLTIENLIVKLQGLRYFFQLDIADAFFQIPIKKSSRKYLVIATQFGNMYFKRLAQGVKNASDIFDNAMQLCLQGLPNVTSYRDDVWGGGRTEDEHNEILTQVIKRFNQLGVVIKAAKSKVLQEEVRFLGYILNKEGLSPDPEKVAAIKSAPRPETGTALISFLCTVGFSQRFIHRFSEKTAQLHDLARQAGAQNVTWDKEHTELFEELKNALMVSTINNTFNTTYETSVWCDASKNSHSHNQRGGFSAVLAQRKDSNSEWRPVYFASRRMTDPQSRWGQTELESESIKFACEKFKYYLEGIPFVTIYTDCKALISLYNRTDKASIPPRIERAILSIQHLNYFLVYIPGKLNKSDWPSRNPHEPAECSEKFGRKESLLISTIKTTSMEQISNISNFLVSMIKIKTPDVTPIDWQTIKLATSNDQTLTKIKKAIENSNWQSIWKDQDIKPYRSIYTQLSCVDGIILNGQKLIVPSSMRSQLLELGRQIVVPESMRAEVARSHHFAGHQGVSKSFNLLKRRYYWPGAKKDIEEATKKCEPCMIIKQDHRKEPIKHAALPEFPFHSISCDFKGPLQSGHYILSIICLYSRWPEMYTCTSTSLKSVKKHFLRYFSVYGHPKIIKSDGGPPFNSKEWEKFLENEKIKPRVITPMHPRANGEAEKSMQLIRKALQLAKLNGSPFEEEISRVLHSYRATPNSTTGKSPAELAGLNRFYHNYLGDSHQLLENCAHTNRGDLNKEITEKRSKDTSKKKRNVKAHNFVIGDRVLINLDPNDMKKKPLFPYDTNELYTITHINGSTITAVGDSGKTVTRDSSKLKKWLSTAESAGDVVDVVVQNNTAVQSDTAVPQGAVVKEDNNRRPHTRSQGKVKEESWVRRRQF